MVKFIDVDPTELNMFREGRRGRISYPMIKSFMETNKVCVQIDRAGMQQSFQGLYSMLTSYCRNHDLPVKIFSQSGQIYLMRLDIDSKGRKIPDWKELNQKTTDGDLGAERDLPPVPITSKEVKVRSKTEKRQSTK